MAGFRSSIFGFNRDDVMEYIIKSREENKKSIDALKEELNKSNEQIENLKAENAKLTELINDYKSKSAEVERLGKSIAKMHIIASSNAKTVLEHTNESVSISANAVKNNVQIADSAEKALMDIKTKVDGYYSEFSRKIEELDSSFTDIKAKINENNRVSREKINTFFETFNKVDNTK